MQMRSIQARRAAIQDTGTAALAGSIAFLSSTLSMGAAGLSEDAWCGSAIASGPQFLGHCAACWQAAILVALVAMTGLRLRRKK
jgi:hypothetical protein